MNAPFKVLIKKWTGEGETVFIHEARQVSHVAFDHVLEPSGLGCQLIALIRE